MLKRLGFVLGLALVALAAPSPARATFIDEGVTYTVFDDGSAGTLGEAYTLQITGINGLSDTVGGRFSLAGFAFVTPSGFISATAPADYTENAGGLSSSGGGCDGSGGFFCFAENTVGTTALPANTTLDFLFAVKPTLGAVDVCAGTPSADSCTDADLKVAWAGTANSQAGKFNGYDHLSADVGITACTSGIPGCGGGETLFVPEPGILFIFGSGLAGLAALLRRYRKLA